MPRRIGAVHVATVKSTYRDRVYETTLLRRTYREDGKVKHETLGNISHLPPHVIEMIRGSLQGQIYVPVSESFEVVRNRPHGHVAAVLGTLRKIGLEGMLASRPSRERDLAVAMVVSRILNPSSKLATCRSLEEETKSSTMGELLELGSVDENDLYGAMDWLVARPGADRRQAGQETSGGWLSGALRCQLVLLYGLPVFIGQIWP